MPNEVKWNMRGRLKPNANKRQASHPDMRGICTINDEAFYISAWWNDDGETLSMRFQTPESAQQWQRENNAERGDSGGARAPAKPASREVDPQQPQQQTLGGEFDDDIPF
jgi:hypothetical protein